MLKWGMERIIHGVPDDPPPERFERALASPLPPGHRGLAVTWIGHAAVLLQFAGRNVLLDPMFGDRASPVAFAGPRRWVPPGIAIDVLPDVHTVLLSHNHYDHLDAGSVQKLAHQFPGAEWFVPLGVATQMRALGVERVWESDWWNTSTSGPLAITATPAQHFSSRTPFDRNRSLWCGWAIAGGGCRVFFAGDTGYHPAFADIGRRLGPFDLQLHPIGAYEPRWLMRPVHMNPEEAVQGFLDTGDGNDPGGVMVPVHWGTFKLTDESMDEPPRRVQAAWESSGLPAERLWLLRHGETRVAGECATNAAGAGD
jgi:N-acyl-phosphatidylethanolamine-hydrolysing phospholipase D